MTFVSKEEAKICIFCGGLTPSWTSDATAQVTVHTPWGDFTIHYHKVCYNEDVFRKKVTELAMKEKPDDVELPPSGEKK